MSTTKQAYLLPPINEQVVLSTGLGRRREVKRNLLIEKKI